MISLFLIGAAVAVSDTEEILGSVLGRHLLESKVSMISSAGCDTGSNQCGLCQGDCDSDAECKHGYKCFHRYDDESVPGCAFGSDIPENMDVCWDDSTPVGSSADNNCTDSEPCTLCLGDCQGDDDFCEGELKCFHRGDGTIDVPGCDYNYGSSIFDVCMNPNSTDVLVFEGWDDCGKGSYKCPHCHGDCDTDDDCADGLVCFQRNDGELVPNCYKMQGSIRGDVDVCVDPARFTEILESGAGVTYQSTLRSSACSEADPCQWCEGECTTNDDCEGHLICYIPSMFGKIDHSEVCEPLNSTLSTFGVCTHALDGYTIPRLATECSETNPCEMCQGDCNSDADCISGACFQRDDHETVPGCSLMDERIITKRDDVCYNRTVGAVIDDSSTCTLSDECNVCEGSCTTDDECLGALVCITRAYEDDTGKYPGCDLSTGGYVNFCYNPPTNQTLLDKGETVSDGSCVKNGCGCGPALADQCEICQGDCNTDDDCEGPLRCYQRDEEEEPIPGCYQLFPIANDNHDFCYDFCFRNHCAGNRGSCDKSQGRCDCGANKGEHCEFDDTEEADTGIQCEAIQAARDFPHYEGGDPEKITEAMALRLYDYFYEVTQTSEFITAASGSTDGSPPSWSGHKYVWENIAANSKWEDLCDHSVYTGQKDPNGPILCNIGMSEFAEEVRNYIKTYTNDTDCWPKHGHFTMLTAGGLRQKCQTLSGKYTLLYRSQWYRCAQACEEDYDCSHFTWRPEADGFEKCILHEECGTETDADGEASYEFTGSRM